MNKQRRRYSVMLAGLLSLVLVLGACSSGGNGGNGGNGSGGNTGTGTNNAGGEQAEAGLPMNGGKYDPPVTVSYLRSFNSDVTFKNGDTAENNVHTKWAKEKLGIDLKLQWVAGNLGNNAFDTKLRLALSSNEKMPDIISCRCDFNLVRELIDSGKFVDGGELFDKYASDTWKAAMAEDETVWYPYMNDGKRIGIPILDYAYNGDPVLWVREDWKTKLNLPDPKTLDDVEKMMDAFVNQDPDGNGKKDTYGLALGIKNNLNTWMSEAGWVFGAYGTMPNQWNLTESGELEYGSINPGVEKGLTKIKEWLDKGYVHKEAALWDETKASELFTSGQAGIIAGPHWMPYWPLEDVKKNVPGSSYKAYPIPTGPDGKAGRHGTPSQNGVVLINKDMKNPEVFFTYQNYLFDHFANPEVGGEFENGMVEGYDWAMVDGKPTTDTNKIPGGGVPVNKYTLTFDGARIPSLTMKTLSKLASGAEPETPFEKITKSGAPEPVFRAAQIVMEQKDITMTQMFTGAPTPTQQEMNDILTKLEKDTFSQMLYGKMDIKDFGKFVEKWKSSGGEQVTKEVNEWYQSVAGK